MGKLWQNNEKNVLMSVIMYRKTVKNAFSYLDYEKRSNEFITQEKWVRGELGKKTVYHEWIITE